MIDPAKKSPKSPKSSKEAEGYPLYPSSEDIFEQNKEEKDLDPEQPSRKKSPNQNPDALNEKGFEEDETGEDLDIPGNESDEEEENEGSEDEENNYYSIGDEPK
jgi:hypothetical protein